MAQVIRPFLSPACAMVATVVACCSPRQVDAPRASNPNAGTSDILPIPAGTFQMGMEPGQTEGHTTTIHEFWLDRAEVTVRAYETCVAEGKCTPAERTWKTCNHLESGRHADHPANCVNWNQANAYCRSKGMRLPTEQEWEFAARGSDGRLYPWGNAKPEGQACSGKDLTGTCPVTSHPQDLSPFAILDMAGNVKEWTATPAALPGNVKAYVIRGGGWEFDGLRQEMPISVTERDTLIPAEAAADVGFRCASDRKIDRHE